MRNKIQNIDDDDFNEPDDFDEDFIIDFDDDDEPDCQFCNATGEGYGDNLRCPYCNGRGTIKRKH